MRSCLSAYDCSIPWSRYRYELDACEIFRIAGRYFVAKATYDGRRNVFCSRIIKCPALALKRFDRPLLLHWGGNHFVVLEEVSGGRYIIHDPARGRVCLDESEFLRQFTGYALDVEPKPDFVPLRAERHRRFTGELATIFRTLTGALSQLLALALCLELLSLAGPLLVQWVIDRVMPRHDLDLLSLLAGLFVVALVVKGMLTVLRDWTIASVSAIFVRQWGGDVFGHLMRLPLTYFEKRNIGDILSRYISIQSIQSILSSNILASIIDGSTLVIAFALVTTYSWMFAALAAFALGLYAAVRFNVYNVLMLANQDQISTSARQESLMIESVRGIATIKLFNDQGGRTQRFLALFTLTLNKMIRVRYLSSLARAGNEVILGACRVSIIALGARQVIQGHMEVGAFVAMLAYVEMFLVRAGGIVDNIIELRLLDLHFDRIGDIIQPDQEDLGKGNAPRANGVLSIDNVSFRYADDEPWIIRNFSEIIHPGECVAITGPSGAGKTTLVKLIVGFIKPIEGTIRFNGVDIVDLGIGAFRSICGTVLQSDRLFSGSLEDNITFFEKDPDMKRLQRAAELAAIKQDIDRFPMGFKTLVGDMGSILSSGQAQRVLLARAIYRNPLLLVLDEATNHLDIRNEQIINDNIETFNMTRIMVAHRPETIAKADRVIRLDGRDQQGGQQ